MASRGHVLRVAWKKVLSISESVREYFSGVGISCRVGISVMNDVIVVGVVRRTVLDVRYVVLSDERRRKDIVGIVGCGGMYDEHVPCSRYGSILLGSKKQTTTGMRGGIRVRVIPVVVDISAWFCQR